MSDLLARLLAPWLSHPARLDNTEAHMATTDDLVARLSTATDEIASDLKSLRDEVAGSDSAAAAKFEPLISRLEAMGADSSDPVPDEQPAPVDETPVDETPVDGDQPA